MIDISGDGANDQDRPMLEARNEAVAKSIVINSMPLMLKRPNSFDSKNLDIYYRACVIGGPGSFMIRVWEQQQFAAASRTKLIREIAGLTAEPSIVPAQVKQHLDCR